MNPRLALFVLFILSTLNYQPSTVFAQGNLAPPGAPAPTMKSLDQIASQGIALNSTNTPGDASNHFIINQPGTYYLTGNLVVTETEAIRINVAGVTIDLNGFRISTANATPDDGITIRPGADHCTIKNGSIVGFGQGIDVITQSQKNCRFFDIAVSNCTNWGIRGGEGSVIESCRAHDCSGASAAIGGGVGSTLRDCTASHNTTVNAIQALAGSTLINCTATNNTGTNAISASNGSTLTNCAATANTVTNAINTGGGCSLTNCSADSNTATNAFNNDVGCSLHNCNARQNTGTYGFNATSQCSFMNCTAANNTSSAATSAGFNTSSGGCTFLHCNAAQNTTTATATLSTGIGFIIDADSKILQCTADGNTGDGIHGFERCFVSQNHVFLNTDTAAGIHTTSVSNVIDGNYVVGPGNGTNGGIQVGGANNLIIRNVVNIEGPKYVISAGNSFGTIVQPNIGNAVNGSTASSTLTTADPWANFGYPF